MAAVNMKQLLPYTTLHEMQREILPKVSDMRNTSMYKPSETAEIQTPYYCAGSRYDTDQVQSRPGSGRILQELSPGDPSFFTGGAEPRTCRRRAADVTVRECRSRRRFGRTDATTLAYMRSALRENSDRFRRSNCR
ncbi:hypothetical protein Bbelb_339910 [Branchiostoma belcheri]|nr:hypothetical protein Bbelb_339910 [Branchiostoma belcheri]